MQLKRFRAVRGQIRERINEWIAGLDGIAESMRIEHGGNDRDAAAERL
jgi:hypothetical protein